ncbi:MAG: transglutaminase domain-containing protein, partial [Clostridia bacterium]|nr:transglutaminase domain-containing protein [Clostridia bacterium]
FAIPRREDKMEDALLGVTLPEGIPLEFNGISIVDEETWEPMEVIGNEDVYLLTVFMMPEEGYRFLSETTEDGETVYTGRVTINGEPLDSAVLFCNIDNDEITWSLMCEYRFRPEGAEGEGYVFNPHLYVPILDGDIPQEYWDSFYNLCDALRAGETTFACASMKAYKWATDPVTLTELFPPACTRIKGEDRDGTAGFENGIGKIFYQMPVEEYMERQAQFEALIVDTLNTCLEPDDDAFEKCLKLFDYMSVNYAYQYDFQELMSDGANYLTFMTGKGQCIELASVYAYYLLQAGVEALQVGCNNTEIAHAWTYTVIDGRGYHTDPTWSLREFEAGEELELYYFLMTDERREGSGCAVDDLTAPLLPRYWANFSASEFTASDDRYCFPADSFLMSIDEEGKTVHYRCCGEEYDLNYAQK